MISKVDKNTPVLLNLPKGNLKEVEFQNFHNSNQMATIQDANVPKIRLNL